MYKYEHGKWYAETGPSQWLPVHLAVGDEVVILDPEHYDADAQRYGLRIVARIISLDGQRENNDPAGVPVAMVEYVRAADGNSTQMGTAGGWVRVGDLLRGVRS